MAWAEKRGKRWYGVYRDATGRKRYAGSADSKAEAQEAAEAEAVKVRAGEWRDPRLTLSQYVEERWLPAVGGEAAEIARRVSDYKESIKPYFGAMRLGDITPTVVARWLAARRWGLLDDGAGPLPSDLVRRQFNTLAEILGALSGPSAVRDGFLDVSPCVGVTLAVDVGAPEAPDDITAAAARGPVDMLDDAIALLLAYRAAIQGCDADTQQ